MKIAAEIHHGGFITFKTEYQSNVFLNMRKETKSCFSAVARRPHNPSSPYSAYQRSPQRDRIPPSSGIGNINAPRTLPDRPPRGPSSVACPRGSS